MEKRERKGSSQTFFDIYIWGYFSFGFVSAGLYVINNSRLSESIKSHDLYQQNAHAKFFVNSS